MLKPFRSLIVLRISGTAEQDSGPLVLAQIFHCCYQSISILLK